MKVCYVVSGIDKALAFEWLASSLPAKGVEPCFIIVGERGTALEHHLLTEGVKYKVVPMGRPHRWPVMAMSIRKAMKSFSPHVVHTHLREGTLLGLWAARSLGVNTRIYTRHHSTFHHDYHPRAVWLDRLCNRWATHVVAISQVVKDVLVEREKVEEDKVRLVHHGFDLERFRNVRYEEVARIRSKYLGERKGPVLGVIARYINWKGHHTIVEAFSRILEQYPDATLVLANSKGPDSKEVKGHLAATLPPASYVEIPFEQNVFALYKLFDVYVHVPRDPQIEAFGQTYVEALASGVPGVFSKSGVAHEFIEHGENALVVPYEDPMAVSMAVFELLEEPSIKDHLIHGGWESVQAFGLEEHIQKLCELYEGKQSVLQHHHPHL